jgi:hypothetical protein
LLLQNRLIEGTSGYDVSISLLRLIIATIKAMIPLQQRTWQSLSGSSPAESIPILSVVFLANQTLLERRA